MYGENKIEQTHTPDKRFYCLFTLVQLIYTNKHTHTNATFDFMFNLIRNEV